jgi:hypothetical protein
MGRRIGKWSWSIVMYDEGCLIFVNFSFYFTIISFESTKFMKSQKVIVFKLIYLLLNQTKSNKINPKKYNISTNQA